MGEMHGTWNGKQCGGSRPSPGEPLSQHLHVHKLSSSPNSVLLGFYEGFVA